MKKIFRSEQKVSKYYRTHAPKDVVEKQIIMDFFTKIPIESLKKLINFQEIDFENKKLWNKCKSGHSVVVTHCPSKSRSRVRTSLPAQ